MSQVERVKGQVVRVLRIKKGIGNRQYTVRNYLLLLVLLALACAQLPGGDEPTAEPGTVTVDGNATPTLAPTATIDPNATPTSEGQAISAEATPTIATAGTGGPDGEATPGSGNGSNGENGSNGSNGSNGENGSNGSNGNNGQGTAACPAGGQNLLTNPSFEGEYRPFGAFTELNHAPNWFPWWTDGDNNLRPEYKPAESGIDPRRVHSGSRAQQYFKSHGQFKAGLYQIVLNVTPGSRFQFSAHGQGWSCADNSQCPGAISFSPANMLMRVGIDPLGGTDAFSSDIVWSAYFSPIDQWQVACAAAVAESDRVTVFLWASPDAPRQNQDVYWDDASLVIVP
jgi:putative component of toxin-antitoxin plasmid stabilization module